MKTRTMIFAIGLLSSISTIHQATAGYAGKDGGDAGSRPRVLRTAYTPIIADVDNGMACVTFVTDLGVVSCTLEAVSDKKIVTQTIDTSCNNNCCIAASAGTYLLRVTTENGITLFETTVLIP